MLYPLTFKPIFQERIWGGRSLEKLYKKKLPAGIAIGESWEICDRPEAQSVVESGPLAGQTLAEVMRQHRRELLGSARASAGRFPLLVKILDAREKLSLQVHPPADQAAALGGEPKTEMWYVAQADPGAELYAGLRNGVTRAEFEERIRSETVAECFHRVPVRKGDAMFLPSGRVHAIGAGLVIFEIQQNSDTTYRVFDWNRRDAQGRARPLHVAESLRCIDFNDFEPAPIRPEGKHQTLVDNPLFRVEALDLNPGETFERELDSCLVLAVTDGTIQTHDPSLPTTIVPGGFCLLPATMERVRLSARTPSKLLITQPGKQ